MIRWKMRNSKSSAVLRAKSDCLLLYMLDNALMRRTRTKCTSTSNDHEEQYSKYCSTSDTPKCRKSTSLTSSHSCGPGSSPSQVLSKCARHPSIVAAASLTRWTETPEIDPAVHSDRQVQNQAQACPQRPLYHLARRARALCAQEVPSWNTQGLAQPPADAGDACSVHWTWYRNRADEVHDPRESS